MKVLPITLAALLLICLLRFGRPGLARLAALRLRGGWLAVVAALLQLAAIELRGWRLELLLLSAAPLACFCWLNRNQPGLALISLGVALNLLVMALNGGAMPISPATLAEQTGLQIAPGTFLPKTKDRVLAEEATALAWLSDRLMLPGPLKSLASWSVGDALLIGGVGTLLWQTMKGTDRARHPLWGETTVS